MSSAETFYLPREVPEIAPIVCKCSKTQLAGLCSQSRWVRDGAGDWNVQRCACKRCHPPTGGA